MNSKDRYPGNNPYAEGTRSKRLRDIAERKATEKVLHPEALVDLMTPDAIRETLHDLQVHQIELAMQNEQLREAQLELEESRSRYYNLYDQAPVGYFTLLETDTIQDANLMVARFLRLPQDVLTGEPLTRFIHKSAQDAWYLKRKHLFETGEPQSFDLHMVGADGAPFWGNLSMTLSQESEEGPNCRVVLVDVSERKKLEADLALEKKLLETTLGSIGDGVISTDRTGNVVYMNRVAESMTGWSQEDARGKSIHDVFHVINEFTRESSDGNIDRILRSGKAHPMPSHTILVSKGGEEYPIEDSAAPILQENGEIVGAVMGFRDFTEKKKKIEEIKFLSYHDQLTGLYNRRFFEEELKRVDTERNLPLTIVMGDVNGLKLINDSFGHAVGDELLRKVAKAIRMGCRDDEIVARLGGDEFVIILPRTDMHMAERIICRIQDFAAKNKVGSIDISISFGFETKRHEEESIQDIFRETENHMYRQKLSESASIRNKTIEVIMHSLFEKNNGEMQHAERVGKLSAGIAAEMNLSEEAVSQIRIAGRMHDIGNIGIDASLLTKPMKLNPAEWTEMERHSEIGYRILSTVNAFSEIAIPVLEHHERWNGKGYPKGLKHEDISLQARIISVADAFDVMTGTRAYGKPLSITEAVQEIIRCSGTQFDPSVTQVFVKKILGLSWQPNTGAAPFPVPDLSEPGVNKYRHH